MFVHDTDILIDGHSNVGGSNKSFFRRRLQLNFTGLGRICEQGASRAQHAPANCGTIRIGSYHLGTHDYMIMCAEAFLLASRRACRCQACLFIGTDLATTSAMPYSLRPTSSSLRCCCFSEICSDVCEVSWPREPRRHVQTPVGRTGKVHRGSDKHNGSIATLRDVRAATSLSPPPRVWRIGRRSSHAASRCRALSMGPESRIALSNRCGKRRKRTRREGCDGGASGASLLMRHEREAGVNAC